MSLRGRGSLPIWFELAEGFEREFDRWHTIEHMPERLGIPGFLRGRRYFHARSDRIFFQPYEGSHIELFRSPGYLARLNAPTDWSNQVQPSLFHFVRGACRTLISLGEGVGGALLTLRIVAGEGSPSEAGTSLIAAATAVIGFDGVTAVHVGEHVPHITHLETAETQLRPPTTASKFDYVLLVEGIGTPYLEDATPKLISLATVQGAEPFEPDIYRLAYCLDDDR